MRIFSVFVLSGTLSKTVAVTFPCYGSGDVLLKAARHENIVKVANSGTLRLINIYICSSSVLIQLITISSQSVKKYKCIQTYSCNAAMGTKLSLCGQLC